MLDAPPFADQARSGDRAILQTAAAFWALALKFVGKGVQAFEGFRAEAAMGELLDALGQPAFEEAPVGGRRLALEQLAPFLFEPGNGRGFQGGQLRQYGISHPIFSVLSGSDDCSRRPISRVNFL